MANKIQESCHYPEVGIPFFWTFGVALKMGESAWLKNIKG